MIDAATMKGVTATDLEKVPPLPLSTDASTLTTSTSSMRNCDGGTCKIKANDEEASGAKPKSTSNEDAPTSRNEIQSPEPNKPNNITPTTSPQKTPISITRYIQTAERELEQMNQDEISSPRTPSNNIASPDFIEYIRSTEKELDLLLKETLASPTNSKRNDSMEVSLESSLNELRRDLSFQEEMDLDEGSVDVPRSDGDKSETDPDKDDREGPEHDASNTKKKHIGIDPVGGEMQFLFKAFLLSFCMAVGLSIVLGSIYPASPLSAFRIMNFCQSNNLKAPCAATYDPSLSVVDRFQLGLATITFVIGTSIRTIISAPLQRLDDKLKSRQLHFPLVSQILNMHNHLAGILEKSTFDVWEDTAKRYHVLKDGSMQSSSQPPPELDLGVSVPCNIDHARIYLLEDHNNSIDQSSGSSCFLRDVITHELLMELAAVKFDFEFSLATHPLILRNLWPKESFEESSGSHRRRLTPSGILDDSQLSNFILPNYFSDASKTGYDALVPDSVGTTLSQFVTNIQTGNVLLKGTNGNYNTI
jgi:hypothetical protein